MVKTNAIDVRVQLTHTVRPVEDLHVRKRRAKTPPTVARVDPTPTIAPTFIDVVQHVAIEFVLTDVAVWTITRNGTWCAKPVSAIRHACVGWYRREVCEVQDVRTDHRTVDTLLAVGSPLRARPLH